jgi:hypothetical protein
MITDVEGCSTCKNGHEYYESYKVGRKTFVQYDFRKMDGELFSCNAPTLETCRQRRDSWLTKRGNLENIRG